MSDNEITSQEREEIVASRIDMGCNIPARQELTILPADDLNRRPVGR